MRSSISSRSTLLTAVLFGVAPAMAQSTWVVDPNGGAGSNFTTLAAATAAATAGDVIVARAGIYHETLDLDRGVRVFGEPGATLSTSFLASTVRIHDLPADESAAVVGFTLGEPGPTSSNIQCVDCDGVIVLDSLTSGGPTGQGTPSVNLSATDCDQVQVVGCFLRGAAIFKRCHGSLAQVILEGTNPSGALRIEDATVTAFRCTISLFSAWSIYPPVYVQDGSLRLAHSNVFNGVTPATTSAVTGVALYAAGGTTVVDPATTLTPAASYSAMGGPGQSSIGLVDAARVRWTAGHVAFDYISEPDAFFATGISIPATVTPSPYGYLWLDPANHFVFDFGQLDANGEHRRDLPHFGVPRGFTLVVQPVFLKSNDIHLANGSLVIYR